MFLTKVSLLPSSHASNALIKLGANGVYASHQLLWELFPGKEKRDFLYREDVAEGGRPQFFVLSKTLPEKHHALFATQSKEFNPKFYKGQRLSFKLRVNPTVCLKDESGKSKRHDVLMHAKYQAKQEGITSQNQIKLLMNEAAQNWIANQKRLDEWGVTLDALPDIECYSQHKSQKKNHTMKFSSVDYQGVLTITDPVLFSAQYEKGFGRAKAMGCGLMLVRPI